MKKVFATLLMFLFLGVASVWTIGGQLSAPAFAEVGGLSPEYNAENVMFDNVHGWYFPARQHKACILLMHGVRSNRQEMIGRAMFLREAGYSSLAIDLQGHGETPGEKITYGYKESNSARLALTFLKTQRQCKKVVSIGSSLGGAASLLGSEPLPVDGYVLEAVYPSIETAVENRLKVRLGSIGETVAPIFYQQIPLRLGIELDKLRPLDAIKKIKSPVLIMNGTADRRTTIEEAQWLYENAPYPKTFVKFEGATHTNLYAYNPIQYKQVVLDFLSSQIDG